MKIFLDLNTFFNNANIGFGAAHNIIMREEIRLGRYHLVLNPDISFEAGTIERLVQFMDQNKDVGICMPKVLYPMVVCNICVNCYRHQLIGLHVALFLLIG